MKILLIFTLCLISDGGASMEVTGYSGGGITIKCKYDREYEQNPKYFCKGSGSSCADQIKTEDKKQWVESGRFSLYDDTDSAEFRVWIRELTVGDSGTYQCGVDSSRDEDIHTPVEVKVKDLNYGSITSRRNAGENMTFTCKYPASHRNDPKFLCKRQTTDECVYKISVNESKIFPSWKSFCVHYDDERNQILSVSMKEVSEQDSGEYWCGAEADWESDHGYKVYITQIKLTVTDPHPASPSVPTQTSSSASSAAAAESSLTKPLLPKPASPPSAGTLSSNEVTTYAGGGIKPTGMKPTVTDPHPASSSVPKQTSSSSSSHQLLPAPTSPTTAFPTSTLITVFVNLVGLLIGISVLTGIFIKRRKKQVFYLPETQSQSSRETNNDNENVRFFFSQDTTEVRVRLLEPEPQHQPLRLSLP